MPVILQSGYVYQGNNKTLSKIVTNGKLGSFVFQGANWVWSNLILRGSNNTLKFSPDPINGGSSGDFSIGTGSTNSSYPNPQSTYDFNPQVFEIDPMGGTGSFELESRELSYTLKFGPVFASYQYTKPGNNMVFNDLKFLFTNISNSSKPIDRKTIYPDEKTTGNTYIQYHYLDVERCSVSSTANNWKNLPNPDSTTDYTVYFSIGPNNTAESVYTDVRLIGFSNEIDNWEYFESSSVFGNLTFNHNRNVPFKEISQRTSHINTLPKEFTILRFYQNPNIIYYTHLKFINLQYTDYNNPPSNSDVLEQWYGEWNEKRKEILLYIEFGISPDAGKTIWWNGVESNFNIGGTTGANLAAKGITSIVPKTINKYLTATLLNYSTKPGNVNGRPSGTSTDNRYNISTDNAVVYGDKPFKYVRIPIWTDLPNDEYANNRENTFQKYECINFEDIKTNTTATHNDDVNIDSTSNKRLNKYWAKYNVNSESAQKFQIGRKNRTNNWKTDIHIDLFYKNGSLKYEGSTDGKTITSK